MSQTAPVTFYHAPHSSSGVTRAMFEELGVPFELVALNLKAGDQRKPEYLAVNPMGKVPAIRHEGVLVTEQPAILMYLADLYPEQHLAPAIGDPLRGPYLRWMVFYGSCYESAIMDFAAKHEPLPHVQNAYGSYDDVMHALAGQVEHAGPWLLGARFTAADVLWGGGLNFGLLFNLVPELPAFRAYVDRVQGRPAMRRAAAADEALAKEQDATTA